MREPAHSLYIYPDHVLSDLYRKMSKARKNPRLPGNVPQLVTR